MKLTEEQKKISTSQKFWDNMEKGKQQIKHWQQQPLSQEEFDAMIPVPAFQRVVGNILEDEIIQDKAYWNIFAASNYHPLMCQSCKSIDLCDCGCREVSNILHGSPCAVDSSAIENVMTK